MRVCESGCSEADYCTAGATVAVPGSAGQGEREAVFRPIQELDADLVTQSPDHSAFAAVAGDLFEREQKLIWNLQARGNDSRAAIRDVSDQALTRQRSGKGLYPRATAHGVTLRSAPV